MGSPWETTEPLRKSYIPEDAQYFGTAVAVEHRYILDIVDGVQGDALEVR
jgi:hypothetical protein